MLYLIMKTVSALVNDGTVNFVGSLTTQCHRIWDYGWGRWSGLNYGDYQGAAGQDEQACSCCAAGEPGGHECGLYGADQSGQRLYVQVRL